MKKLLSTLLSMAIFATLTTPAFAERELASSDALWGDLVAYWQMNSPEGSELSSADTGLWNGLISYWKFNETSGTLYDSKGSNNGTNNGATHGADGVLGNALSFDGAGDSVNVGNHSDLDFEADDPFSFSVWFKTDGTGFRSILNKGSIPGDYQGYRFSITSGGSVSMWLINNWGTSWLYSSTDNTYNDNLWHSATVTYDGSRDTSGLIIYVDNEVVPQTKVDTLGSSNISNGQSLYIGNSPSYAHDYSGNLDNLAIWDRALTPSEIDDLYQRGTTEDEKGTNDGQDNGALSTTGKLNEALSLDGVDDYIDMSNPSALAPADNDWAVSVWFNRAAGISSKEQLVSSINTAFSNWFDLKLLASGQIKLQADDGSNPLIAYTTPATYDDGAWHHVVVTRTASTDALRLYVDGALLTTDTNVDSSIDSNDEFLIGALWSSGGVGSTPKRNFFEGNIDDVAIWDQALTPTEILQLYNMGISPLNATTEYTAAGTTDFEAETDMTSVSNVALYKALDTGVVFSGDMNPKNKDYDNTVKMGPGYITVNSTANPELDRAATVTMNVNTCNDLAIYKDDSFIEDPGNYASIKDRIIDQGTECTLANSCLTTAPTCSGNTATFYVTGFSSFAGEGSGGSGSSVPEFSDYMLMLTFLIAGFAVYKRMPELITEKQ